jgi:hypothetical protein
MQPIAPDPVITVRSANLMIAIAIIITTHIIIDIMIVPIAPNMPIMIIINITTVTTIAMDAAHPSYATPWPSVRSF